MWNLHVDEPRWIPSLATKSSPSEGKTGDMVVFWSWKWRPVVVEGGVVRRPPGGWGGWRCEEFQSRQRQSREHLAVAGYQTASESLRGNMIAAETKFSCRSVACVNPRGQKTVKTKTNQLCISWVYARRDPGMILSPVAGNYAPNKSVMNGGCETMAGDK